VIGDRKYVFTVAAEDVGQRVDKFLVEKLPDFSRVAIQKMPKNFDNARKLKEGDVVEVEVTVTPTQDFLTGETRKKIYPAPQGGRKLPSCNRFRARGLFCSRGRGISY